MSGICLALVLSVAQCRALKIAQDIGGNRLAAVVWVESSFCRNKHNPRNPLVHGCGQIGEQAVITVAGRRMAVWTLTYDDPVNMVLAYNFLMRCQRRFGFPGALACYHFGGPVASHMTNMQREDDPYTRAVLSKMKLLMCMYRKDKLLKKPSCALTKS